MPKVVELIQTAPKIAKEFNEWLQDCEIKEPTLDDLKEFDETYCNGLATILAEVIKECEGIELTSCSDLGDETYLLYVQSYPWFFPEQQKSFKEEDIQSLMVKYLSQITDDAITVDYYEPENYC